MSRFSEGLRIRFAARFLARIFLLLVLSASVHATPDDDFLAARDAFNARNSSKLNQLASKLQGHVLAPFVRYWQLSLQLEQTEPEEVQAFLEQNADSYISDRLRADWLKVLGQKQRWDLLQTQYPLLINENNDITCYQLQARLAKLPADLTPLQEAKRLWFSGKDQPDSCNSLFDRLAEEKMLTVDEVFARLRLALEEGNVSVARYVTNYLPNKYHAGLKNLEAVAENPARFLDKSKLDLETRGGRELALFAAHRIARTDPDSAISHWNPVKAKFSEEEQAYVAGQIAYQLARRHSPLALTWYGQAQGTPLNDLQAGWKARAAMRVPDWPALESAIQAMSETEQRRPEWRYWKARALRASGRQTAATEILVQLSRETNFYGQLASEELGPAIGPAPVSYKPTEAEVSTAAANPTLQRALALYRLNLRPEGLREWAWGMRKLDDKQLLAAAELARRNDLIDRSISSADRTQQLHDFSLRYPAPHRETMLTYTKPLDLDDAWVYGLVRQESRFVSVARSSVGASGMMQLMPATAKWVARKLGMKGFHLGAVNQLETNFQLGTYYLKHVQDLLFGNAVLATAAYNAGPGRARKWQDNNPLDSVAYIESIPFNETRDYVKKVMSNSAYYAARFGSSLTSLKQRIGTTIPGKRSDNRDFTGEP